MHTHMHACTCMRTYHFLPEVQVKNVGVIFDSSFSHTSRLMCYWILPALSSLCVQNGSPLPRCTLSYTLSFLFWILPQPPNWSPWSCSSPLMHSPHRSQSDHSYERSKSGHVTSVLQALSDSCLTQSESRTPCCKPQTIGPMSPHGLISHYLPSPH